MTEDQKQQTAVFRFGVIADLVSGNLDPGDQERLILEKSHRKWTIPFSTKTRISRSTILRWIRLYRNSNGNLRSLYPEERSDRGKPRAMDDETAANLIQLRREMPKAPVAKLIQALTQRRLVAPGTALSQTSVYRFLNHHGLMRDPGKTSVDRRKFEAQSPNDIWQSDVMHGPSVMVGNRLKKTYLVAFIDDHSRLVPHARFYLSERLDDYMHAFETALLTRGLPRKLYVDNGAAFRSHHLEHVAACLGIALIHSKPYTPQGRGKIERFFRTVRSQLLSGIQTDDLETLNRALSNWIQHDYHQRKHSATGQNPFNRFTEHTECLRNAPKNLRDYFRKLALRRVAKDRTVTLDGRLYEAPVPLIGLKVQLLFHTDEPESVEVQYQQKSYGLLRPVDLNVNCRARRDKNNEVRIEKKPYSTGELL